MADPGSLALAVLAGLVGGGVNAIAGGGSLLSFPALIAAGLSPLSANVTNTVAMVPGYLGATLAQRQQLGGQAVRLALLLPLAAFGGLTGGLLLLVSDARLFERLVPWLLLLGSLLLAAQEPLSAWLRRRQGSAGGGLGTAAPAITLTALYGGYFGAGLGVIVVAALALTIEDSFSRINALKQAIALSANLMAALLFVMVARPPWPTTVLMALAALAGGALGGRLVARLDPVRLRGLVVLIGLVMAALHFLR